MPEINHVRSLKVGAKLSHSSGYGNDHIEIEVALTDKDNYEEVYQRTKSEVYRLLGRQDWYEANQRLRREYDDLCSKVKKAHDQWEQTRTFLVAQGLKSDAPPFPQLPLLAEATQPSLVGELVDNNDPLF